MKTYKTLFLNALVCGAIIASGLALAKQPSNDKAAILEAVQAMWTATEQSNLDAYLEHIHQDYSLFGESDVYLHKGKDAERRDIADFLNRGKVIRTFMHQPEITVRGDTAWLTYYWSDAGMSAGERYTSRGKSTRIFVKENGKWLCIHSHFTAVP